MWRLWHRLFGWHYVAVTYGDSDSICRVIRAPNGEFLIELMGEFYRSQNDFDRVVSINTDKARACTPLTWRRSLGSAA